MRRQGGFTLLETIIVLVLAGAIFALAAGLLSRKLPGQQLRIAAKEVAAQLRYTRAQALASGQSQVFSLDARTREWNAAGRHHGKLPGDVQIVATGARNEAGREGVAAVRFFPEGAATGGRFVLSHDDAAWQVDVQWLTGEVSLQRAAAQ